MVLLAADRMARTPVGMSPGWHDLAWEMALGSSLRTVEKQAGFAIAARACYHAAWRFFDNRWLNISSRKLTELPGRGSEPEPSESAACDGALQAILEAVESIRIREIGRMTRDYLNSGHSGNRLLSELGLTILKDDNGWSLLHTLRTVFDEWEHCAGHPARGQLLVGLARWATDARRSIGSQSAAQTAQLLPAGRPRSSCTNNTAGGVRCADSLPCSGIQPNTPRTGGFIASMGRPRTENRRTPAPGPLPAAPYREGGLRNRYRGSLLSADLLNRASASLIFCDPVTIAGALRPLRYPTQSPLATRNRPNSVTLPPLLPLAILKLWDPLHPLGEITSSCDRIRDRSGYSAPCL